MKRFIFLGLVILAIALATNLYAQSQLNEKISIPEEGKQAPDFSLLDFEEKNFTLSELKGNKAVLLWFTNLCQGCLAKISEIEKIKNLYEKKGIEVVAVSMIGEDRETVKNVISKKKVTFRFLYDPKNEATELYSGGERPGVCPLRNIFIIQKDGKIAYAGRYPGTQEAEIISQLNEAMK